MNREVLCQRLEKLKREHFECEDTYYSCASITDFDYREGKCNCGANSHNKEIDDLIKEIKAAKEI